MGWNNAYETKKFESKQKKQAEEYKALGMTDEQIAIMYEFDLQEFNSNRRYREHIQSFLPEDFDADDDNDEKLSIFEKFKDVLTTSFDDSSDKSRHWWVEEIEDDSLALKVKALSVDDIELITLYVFDGYTQEDIATLYMCTKQNIQKKFRRIKNILR